MLSWDTTEEIQELPKGYIYVIGGRNSCSGHHAGYRLKICRDLVSTEKPVEGEISVCCAHSDVIINPLAKVAIEI